MIEKAYAQAEGSFEEIEYGYAHEAIAAMTGHHDFTVAAPSSFSAQAMQTAIDEGRSVTVTSYSGDNGDKTRTENGIVSSHV